MNAGGPLAALKRRQAELRTDPVRSVLEAQYVGPADLDLVWTGRRSKGCDQPLGNGLDSLAREFSASDLRQVVAAPLQPGSDRRWVDQSLAARRAVRWSRPNVGFVEIDVPGTNGGSWPNPPFGAGLSGVRITVLLQVDETNATEGRGALVVGSLSRCRPESVGVRKRVCARTFQVRQASNADDRSNEFR